VRCASSDPTNTENIFICRECGLPIRNISEGNKCADRECFTCERCDVCDKVSQKDMDRVQGRLYRRISNVVGKLYRNNHSGKEPPERFKHAVIDKLKKQSNLAEQKIKEIKGAIGKIQEPVDNVNSKYDLLRQVAASERVLNAFFYLSGTRMALVNSPTLLRHWVALGRKLSAIAAQDSNPESVLRRLEGSRYELNLVRLSKLIGDNPICIYRDREHYKGASEDHIREHLEDLKRQSEAKNLNPKITNMESLFRYAGNACFITEYDEVLELRSKGEKNYLVKYLIKDEILIVLDDLWFLERKAADQYGGSPLANLVTIYPGEEFAKEVMRQFVEGRYLPNCVDLEEISKLYSEVESDFGRI
jgi:hypothetical protein